jgi:hypothetical protein
VLYVRPGAADLLVNGVATSGDEVEVEPGSAIQFGPYTRLRVDAVVESTLYVRNVFGNVAKTQAKLVIQPRGGQRRAAKGEPSQPTFAERGEVR